MISAIHAIPDSAPQPAGSVCYSRQRVVDVVEFCSFLGLRLVWWRGTFYAVAK